VRIPFPERVPVNRVALFAAALAIIQKLEGTPVYFCAGCMVFIVIAAFAFNAAGGLTRASGAYVFFYAMLVVIVGLCYKAYLGEPAQTNLADPRTDIAAYVGSIVAMYGAVVLSQRLSRRKAGLLQNLLKESDMHRASIGCMLFGAVGPFALVRLGESAAPLQSAFAQLNALIPVGILIGIMYEIRRSGGTRCMNLFVILGTAYSFFTGMTGFSKQGMILPLFCWLLPICALRYRLSFLQLCAGFLSIFVVFYYLVPYSQTGRDMVTATSTPSERMDVVTKLLEHPNQTRRHFLEREAEDNYNGIRGLNSYYTKPQGFWERLQFISPDDALNNITDQGHVFGLLPVKLGFINIVPHFLWPSKPGANLGNMYSHEITGEQQGEGDVTTGISFSPTGEAYHLEKWAGIFVLAPLLWCMLFTIYDALLGDIRESPWGLLGLALFSHAAPEAGIVGTIYFASFGIESFIFCAFFSVWFAPALASLIVGPDRKRSTQLALSAARFEPHVEI
jgi:hypothetical protein